MLLNHSFFLFFIFLDLLVAFNNKQPHLWLQTLPLVKNYEKSEFLLFFQTKLLASFMDAGRGHKTRGQRQRVAYYSQQ